MERHLILGAGCAGLSLALALLEAGVREEIVLVDRRTEFRHDRTWCFWSTAPPVAGAALATHRWSGWRMVAGDGRATVHRSARHPYLHVPADRFYAAALARLERAPNVRLRLGERVLGVSEVGAGVTVRTTGGDLEGDLACDAMGGAGPLNRGRTAGAVELAQRFLGQEVETERPVFDPGVATLMDFRAAPAAGDALRFVYVLPFTPTRALVEDTGLGGGAGRAPEQREVRERAHRCRRPTGAPQSHDFSPRWLDAGAVMCREERGTLPMTTHTFPTVRGPRLFAVGAAAGALRPSTGYAFVRLRRVRAVARAVSGARVPAQLGRDRHRRLDALFLRALAADPSGARAHARADGRRRRRTASPAS